MTTPKEALEKCAAALQLLTNEQTVVKFTGKWSGYGSVSVAIILDQANDALASLEGDAVERVALPPIPDDDADFTPDLARKIIAKYQAILASGLVPDEAAAKDEDEAYEIGKRDGYESAIQDLDIATGGDGEFKGSTIPGQTVDVPAMKQRIIDQFKSAHWREVEMWRLIDLLRSQEGDSVTILCDNPEPCTEAENNAVICNGDWTDWEDRRFSGVSLLDALSAAMIEYKRPKEPTSGAQRTDGGVEADMPSNETATDVMAHPSPMGSRSCDENTIACGVAGVAPGPSGHAAGDTTPRPLPGREEIARIIDPIGTEGDQ